MINKLKVLLWLGLGLILNACVVPEQTDPNLTNPYQTAAVTQQLSASGPVAALYRDAITALSENDSKQAIDYLQRAIKIDPRNATSWHYLAKSYWLREDYSRCLEMIERSYSYSLSDDDLDRANQTLRGQCQNG